MKRIVLSSVLAFALTLSLGLNSCKPEKKELGPRVSQIDGISGNWILNRVAQIDVNVELAFVESDTLLDVSSVYIAVSLWKLNSKKTALTARLLVQVPRCLALQRVHGNSMTMTTPVS